MSRVREGARTRSQIVVRLEERLRERNLVLAPLILGNGRQSRVERLSRVLCDSRTYVLRTKRRDQRKL